MGEQLATGTPHQVTIENCQNLTATGVQAILNCDEQSAQLDTDCGMLTVGGEELNVSELSVQTGQVHITGQIQFIQYTPRRVKGQGGFWKRLIR